MYLQVKPSCALENNELESILTMLTNEFKLPFLSSKEKEALKKSETMWFMLKKDKKIIGLSSLSNHKEDNLKNITIRKEYRNRSLCTKMLTEIKKFYFHHKEELYKPCLTVNKEENAGKLLKLYNNNGFKLDYQDSLKYYMSLK
jgi:hypothetical protein